MAINKKLIHFNTFSTFNSQKLSANSNNDKYTLGIDGDIVDGNPEILYQSICWIKDTKQQWTHGQLYDCSSLVSGENIKTVFGENILGSGNVDGVYVTKFTMYQLRNNYIVMARDIITAIENNKIIIIPDSTLKTGGVIASATVSSNRVILSVLDYIFGVIYTIYGVFPEGKNTIDVGYKDMEVINIQPQLISGNNIKTINGISLLGSEDIDTNNTFITSFNCSNITSGKVCIINRAFIDAVYAGKQILIPNDRNAYITALSTRAENPSETTFATITFLKDTDLVTMTVSNSEIIPEGSSTLISPIVNIISLKPLSTYAVNEEEIMTEDESGNLVGSGNYEMNITCQTKDFENNDVTSKLIAIDSNQTKFYNSIGVYGGIVPLDTYLNLGDYYNKFYAVYTDVVSSGSNPELNFYAGGLNIVKFAYNSNTGKKYIAPIDNSLVIGSTSNPVLQVYAGTFTGNLEGTANTAIKAITATNLEQTPTWTKTATGIALTIGDKTTAEVNISSFADTSTQLNVGGTGTASGKVPLVYATGVSKLGPSYTSTTTGIDLDAKGTSNLYYDVAGDYLYSNRLKSYIVGLSPTTLSGGSDVYTRGSWNIFSGRATETVGDSTIVHGDLIFRYRAASGTSTSSEFDMDALTLSYRAYNGISLIPFSSGRLNLGASGRTFGTLYCDTLVCTSLESSLNSKLDKGIPTKAISNLSTTNFIPLTGNDGSSLYKSDLLFYNKNLNNSGYGGIQIMSSDYGSKMFLDGYKLYFDNAYGTKIGTYETPVYESYFTNVNASNGYFGGMLETTSLYLKHYNWGYDENNNWSLLSTPTTSIYPNSEYTDDGVNTGRVYLSVNVNDDTESGGYTFDMPRTFGTVGVGFYQNNQEAQGVRQQITEDICTINDRTNYQDRFYGVETDVSGLSYVNVPWSSSLPIVKIPSAATDGILTPISANRRNQITTAVSGDVTFDLPMASSMTEYSGDMTELVFVTSSNETPSITFRTVKSSIGILWANDTPPEWKTSTFYEFSFIWDTVKCFWYGTYTTYSNN